MKMGIERTKRQIKKATSAITFISTRLKGIKNLSFPSRVWKTDWQATPMTCNLWNLTAFLEVVGPTFYF